MQASDASSGGHTPCKQHPSYCGCGRHLQGGRVRGRALNDGWGLSNLGKWLPVLDSVSFCVACASDLEWAQSGPRASDFISTFIIPLVGSSFPLSPTIFPLRGPNFWWKPGSVRPEKVKQTPYLIPPWIGHLLFLLALGSLLLFWLGYRVLLSEPVK